MNAAVGSTGENPRESPRTWWLYLLLCRDGRTYAGITPDVATRYQVHVSGRGAKFTRANPPQAILGAEMYGNKSAAMQAECALKLLSRDEKLHWAEQRPYRPTLANAAD